MALSRKYWKLILNLKNKHSKVVNFSGSSVIQCLNSSTVTVQRLFQPQNITPKNADPANVKALSKSQKLMIDTGIISPMGSGTFCLLPLGQRVLQKLMDLVDFEMQKIGAQKLLLPILTPGNLWRATGRFEEAGPELFTLHDRHKKDYILCPTHEETITELVGRVILTRSMLPLRLYQMSTKFRDEKRPRFGLLRSREFIMKDLYTFDITVEDARRTYDLVCDAYESIFKRLGVRYVKVLADSGLMGGSLSHEYHYLSQFVGEDQILTCPKCYEEVGVKKDGVRKELADDQTTCSREECKGEQLTVMNGIEVGHTFLLGTKYSSTLGATWPPNSEKDSAPLEMGCYGIGLTRVMAAAVECLSCGDDIKWPLAIAPYKVCIIPPKKGSRESSTTHLADELYSTLNKESKLKDDVIVHDKAEWTIGKRLQDAKKTGYPYVIVVGKKAVGDNPQYEVYDTRQGLNFVFTMVDIISYLNLQLKCDLENV